MSAPSDSDYLSEPGASEADEAPTVTYANRPVLSCLPTVTEGCVSGSAT